MSVMMRGRSGSGSILGWHSLHRDAALLANVACLGPYFLS